jgi:hypothetical protein
MTQQQPTPYTISIPQPQIDRLHRKLSDTEFPDSLDYLSSSENEWAQGVPPSPIKRLTAHWQNGFDWRKVETELNELPHYETEVEVEGFGGVNVHFVWQKAEGEGKGVPLLFCHGCEFYFFCFAFVFGVFGGGGGGVNQEVRVGF